MPEICHNGLDDDLDGLTDVFDEDCTCQDSIPPNLVPNGDFSQTTGCCANLQISNCLENWVMTGPSPDYVSDNCPNTDLRPDVRFLTNQFNTAFNDGYIFGIVGSANKRINTESVGVCLVEPLRPGRSYALTFDIANLRNDVPDAIFTIIGINRCEDLTNYSTISGNNFCDLGLPYHQLAAVNANTFNDGWNQLEFTLNPDEDIEAIFYASDCDHTTQNENFFMILDNISIREILEVPDKPEIEVTGLDCSVPLILSVTGQPGYRYQWYKDSVEIAGATNSLLLAHEITGPIDGIYHVLITNDDGNCRLSDALRVERPAKMTLIDQYICNGERFAFGDQLLEESGIYYDTLISATGCDSVLQLYLNVVPLPVDELAISICEGQTYSFGGQLLTQSGIYHDTLINPEECIEIIQLQLSVQPSSTAHQTISICTGDAYIFGGQPLTQAGNYLDTLISSSGCDSIISLSLEVTPLLMGDTINVSRPAGTSFLFHEVRYTESGLYEARLSAANGCDSIAFLSIIFYELQLYIPNAFSPNGDGVNDVFRPEGSMEALEQLVEMRIFNRWGDLLFQKEMSSGESPSWNGIHRGQAVADGVYIYYFLWKDPEGHFEKLTGEVTLIR
ncbi:MAG: gliding motility-associated C-terminal domain-containing protein [Saprospiraceae bacterium]|nr:gliding motility-associated C-terminal domain-containing protein [Lewinella sp.]